MKDRLGFKAWLDIINREIPEGSSIEQILAFAEKIRAVSAKAEVLPQRSVVMMRKRHVVIHMY